MKRPENVSFTKYLEANSSLEREEIIKSTYHYINELEKALNMRIVGSSTVKCTECPECGDKEFINKNIVGDGYRMCRSCHQEWWVDIDYKS